MERSMPKRVLLLSKARPEICLTVARSIEMVLDRAEARGYTIPDRVYVDEVCEEELSSRLEAAALRSGVSYGGLGPESCIVYVGWTGVPEVYVVTERCEGLSLGALKGEAMRAAAHSVLHRGLEYYVYTVSEELAMELYAVLGPASSIFLYLVGAGVRGFEASKLLVELDFGEPAESLAEALRDAAHYYEAEGREALEASGWLGASEIFKLVSEAYPYASKREVEQALEELLGVASEALGDDVVDAVVEVVEEMASFPARLGTAERMRMAAEHLVEKLKQLAR